jgi:DNA-directed RNA polymerase
MNLWDEQKSLEEEMKDVTVHSYYKNLEKAKSSKSESSTLYGITLMKHSVEAVVDGIKEFLEDAFKGGKGRSHLTAPMLNSLDPHKAAFLTLKMVIDGVSNRSSLTKVAMTIGGALEDEFKFSIFEEKEKAWFRVIRNEVTKRTSNRHFRRYAIIHTMNKKALVEYEPWSKTDKLSLGCKLIDLLVSKTGIIEVKTQVYGRKHRQTYVSATEKTLDWIEKVNRNGELLSPFFLPTVVPPKDWTEPTGGGYHYHTLRPLPLIKTYNRKYVEEMRSHDMPLEYEAVNALQRTKWAVNKRLLDVMNQAWESGQPWKGVPQRNDNVIPPSPFPNMDKDEMTDDQRQRFVAWKHMASRVHQQNARIKSKRIQFARTLQLAQRFSQYDQFYFPYQMDFRGRKYAVVPFLSPQGTSYAKALLHFAEGKPIENEEQAGWLAIHGANSFGNDKVSFTDRQLFVYSNTDRIVACADDPMQNRWWLEADDPWMFLAFCFEWAGYTREGFGFMSSLPIGMDGSNNGLQHFSAQLLDEVGGAATNLIPFEKPQDIYQVVANRVIEHVKHDAEGSGENAEMARQWLAFGISRKTCKRPVMVVPYGGQRFSCRAYIEEYIIERMEDGHESPWGEDLFKPSQYLTGYVWEAISEVVVSARKAMDWIQDVAARVSKLNLPLIWTSPSGFVVQQQYPSVEERRIKTYIDNTLIMPTLNELDLEKLDKRRAVQGSSPNFVHSMDAAAMTITITKAIKEGINDFAMIHDSYGTHAADTPVLARLIRVAFVEMYTENDVLEQYRQNALEVVDDVPEVPSKGKLDLNQVLDSQFFFA